ncbi:MAG: radical SAM protein [Deltaproteobacteria bacterium]|nr:radical SAM protein [Deltaproteobacteria bacterium]
MPTRLAPYTRFARARLLRDRPFYAHWAITHRCNLECKTCTTWTRGDISSEMDEDRIDELARMLGRLGVMQLSIGGGEPLVSDKLPHAVKAFQAEGIRVRVLTNGLGMKPSVAERMFKLGLREMSFSLDSLNPKVQEEIDAAPGTFPIRIKNLLALAEMFPKKGLAVMNTIVFPDNLHELPRILELGKSVGFYLSFIPVHVPAKGKNHLFYRYDETLCFDKNREKEIRDAYAFLLDQKKRGAPIVNSSVFLQKARIISFTAARTGAAMRASSTFPSAPTAWSRRAISSKKNWETPIAEYEQLRASKGYLDEVRERTAHCEEGCLRPCWAEPTFLMSHPSSLWEIARIHWKTLGRRPAFEPAAVHAILGTA